MNTLENYIKGYPHTQVLLLARYKDRKGKNYFLCKQEGHNNFYYMKEKEVIDRQYFYEDHLEKLSVKYLNNKENNEILSEIKEQQSYKYFVKFIKEQAGEIYEFKL